MRTVLIALLCAGSAAQAQMYKCVDAKGVTHYSDKPRPECKGMEIDIRPQPPISGKVTPAREDLKAAERDFQRRETQRGREEAAEKKKLAEEQRRCETLKAELQRADARRRVPDAAAHEANIAKLNAEIAQKCR